MKNIEKIEGKKEKRLKKCREREKEREIKIERRRVNERKNREGERDK